MFYYVAIQKAMAKFLAGCFSFGFNKKIRVLVWMLFNIFTV